MGSLSDHIEESHDESGAEFSVESDDGLAARIEALAERYDPVPPQVAAAAKAAFKNRTNTTIPVASPAEVAPDDGDPDTVVERTVEEVSDIRR